MDEVKGNDPIQVQYKAQNGPSMKTNFIFLQPILSIVILHLKMENKPQSIPIGGFMLHLIHSFISFPIPLNLSEGLV